MKNLMLSACFLLAFVVSPGWAQVANMDGPPSRESSAPLQVFSPAESPLARRLAGERFQVVRDFGGIDPEVLALFHTKVPAWKIADVGEKFEKANVVADHPVPVRRLLLAGKTPGVWFVLYEHGGFGYRHQLAVFTRDAKSPWRIAAWPSGFDEKLDFEGLQTALKAGIFSERPGHLYY